MHWFLPEDQPQPPEQSAGHRMSWSSHVRAVASRQDIASSPLVVLPPSTHCPLVLDQPQSPEQSAGHRTSSHVRAVASVVVTSSTAVVVTSSTVRQGITSSPLVVLPPSTHCPLLLDQPQSPEQSDGQRTSSHRVGASVAVVESLLVGAGPATVVVRHGLSSSKLVVRPPSSHRSLWLLQPQPPKQSEGQRISSQSTVEGDGAKLGPLQGSSSSSGMVRCPVMQ